MIADKGILHDVFIVVLVNDDLLRRRRIAVARVIPLVKRQRRDNIMVTVPVIPSDSVYLPIVPPVHPPARRRIVDPTAPISRPDSVIAIWDYENRLRHECRL